MSLRSSSQQPPGIYVTWPVLRKAAIDNIIKTSLSCHKTTHSCISTKFTELKQAKIMEMLHK